MISTQSTQSLFWTPSMLKSFKQDWNSPFLFTGSNWVHWLDSVYSQGISCTTKQETILDKDITTLINAASEGCQVTLHDAYKKLASKKIYQENSRLFDYLANAWDRISTAQLLLARQYNVYIDWHFSEYDD